MPVDLVFAQSSAPHLANHDTGLAPANAFTAAEPDCENNFGTATFQFESSQANLVGSERSVFKHRSRKYTALGPTCPVQLTL